MHFLGGIVLAILTNIAGLLAASRYIAGFHLGGDWSSLIEMAIGLMVLNAVLRPFLKLFLGPFIIITLGLGMILVNAAVLAALDFLSPNLSIATVSALIEATILIAVVNFVVDLFVRI